MPLRGNCPSADITNACLVAFHMLVAMSRAIESPYDLRTYMAASPQAL